MGCRAYQLQVVQIYSDMLGFHGGPWLCEETMGEPHHVL